MTLIKSLNPHVRPPDAIRETYKKYQKCRLEDIDSDQSIIDLQRLDPDNLPAGISIPRWTSSEYLRPAFERFVQADNAIGRGSLPQRIPVFTHQSVSGQHTPSAQEEQHG